MSDEPYWKLRVVLSGAILHFGSWDEPELERDTDGRIVGLRATLIADGRYGDTLGFIDWPSVKAVTWRRAGGREEAPAA